MLKEKNIILGITGSIAAYKIVSLVRILKEKKYNLDIIMTKNACQFITPLTLQTLSNKPVLIDMFNSLNNFEIEHIALADKANLILIAPATANIIGKIASGIADDLLSTVIMATKSQVLIAPAMNVNMYNNLIVQQNIKKLQTLNYKFIGPEKGKLACGKEDEGRLICLEKIVDMVDKLLK
ncbi:MAG: flavoprotein [bacterium]